MNHPNIITRSESQVNKEESRLSQQAEYSFTSEDNHKVFEQDMEVSEYV